MISAGAWPLVSFLALCVAGFVVSLLAAERLQARIVATSGVLAPLALAWAGATAMTRADAQHWRLWSVPLLGTMSISIDRLAGLFLLVTAFVALPASLFLAASLPRLAARYRLRAFSASYLALLVTIVGVLVAADVVSFLVSWELMSLLCFLLVGYEHEERRHTRAAFLMLAAGEAGALAVAVALLLLASRAGSLEFAALREGAGGLAPGVRWAVFLLSFFGFGVKAGLAPVNAWLPRAYQAAPAPFIPLLAGATLDLGLYGILRVDGALMPPAGAGPGLVMLVTGAVTALVGILYATTANDLKALLAHSSIENAGIVTVGVGAGLVFAADQLPILAGIALIAALYHLINHSLYKTLLYVGTSTVEAQSGTRDLDSLGGLIRRLPWTAAAFLAGALSIAALPPFNGFVSEWLTLQTMLASAALPTVGVKVTFALCGAALALTAALAVTCFVKAFAMTFLGVCRSTAARDAREADWRSLAPAAFLSLCCLALGATPTYVVPVLDAVVRPLAGASASTALVPPFFAGDPRHAELPPAFMADFASLGAALGQHQLPGAGLVLLHRGGATNPVVYAASPSGCWSCSARCSRLPGCWLAC